MAAGLSLRREQFAEFERAFDAVVRAQLQPEQLTAVLWSDGELPPAQMTLATADQLRDGGPWGQHFPEPLFDGEFLLVQQRLVGGRHLKMVLAHPEAPQQVIDAIAFSIDPRAWPNTDVRRVRIAYRLDINEWRGTETVQLLVEYLEPA
jgi:single-stranded-DNA-specific exonuclease